MNLFRNDTIAKRIRRINYGEFFFFFFDSVCVLYYKCHQVSLDTGESHKDSAKWIKNKKAPS